MDFFRYDVTVNIAPRKDTTSSRITYGLNVKVEERKTL